MALAISNYDTKSESEILDELQNNDFTVSELENIYVYEKNNQNRQSILEEIDTQLTVTVDVPERGYFGQWFDSGGRYTVRRNVKIQREINQGDLQLVQYGSGAPSDEPEVLKSPIGHASTHEPNGPDSLFDQNLNTDASPSFAAVDTGRVSTKDRPKVDVVSFGADPTGQTNSAAAIQDALAHAKTIPGGATVYLPSGEYKFEGAASGTSALELDTDNITIAGEGRGSTVIKLDWNGESDTYSDYTDMGSGFITFIGSSDNHVKNCHLRDFSVHLVGHGFPYQISAKYADWCTLRHLEMNQIDYRQDTEAPGIPIFCGEDEQEINCNNLSIIDIHGHGLAPSNRIIEMAGTRNGIINDCMVRGQNIDGGIAVSACKNVVVSGCNVELESVSSTTPAGINLANVQNGTVANCIIDSANDGLKAGGGGGAAFSSDNIAFVNNQVKADRWLCRLDEPGVTVKNCVFDGRGTASQGIYVRSTGGADITGCTIRNVPNGVATPGNQDTSNVSVSDCTFKSITGYGIDFTNVNELSATNSGGGSINNCTFEEITTDAVRVRSTADGSIPKNILIGNNHTDGSASIRLIDGDYIQAQNNMANVIDNTGGANNSVSNNTSPS